MRLPREYSAFSSKFVKRLLAFLFLFFCSCSNAFGFIDPLKPRTEVLISSVTVDNSICVGLKFGGITESANFLGKYSLEFPFDDKVGSLPHQPARSIECCIDRGEVFKKLFSAFRAGRENTNQTFAKNRLIAFVDWCDLVSEFASRGIPIIANENTDGHIWIILEVHLKEFFRIGRQFNIYKSAVRSFGGVGGSFRVISSNGGRYQTKEKKQKGPPRDDNSSTCVVTNESSQ